jgi:uncharacterized protein YjcR
MKRQQSDKVRECIKKFYQSVSDKAIADKFGVSVLAVKKARQRLGLRKDSDVSIKLRNKMR